MLYLRSPEKSAWEHFMAGESPNIGEALSRCWRRSLSKGADRLDPVKSALEPFLGSSATQERQEANERIWRHVEPVLEGLSQQLTSGGFVGIWADLDGIILRRRGGGAFLSTAQKLELSEGANWNEATRGTNAIGTALDEQCEVAVIGHAHLQRPNHQLVCYAAPIRSPQGEVLGVLDVTSHIGSAHDMALAAVSAARTSIELALKLAAYDETMRGGLEVLCQMIDLCPSPALLVEPDGTLRAANERARMRFGQRPGFASALGWSNILELQQHPDPIDLQETSGVTTTWRPVIERIGPASRPIAALVFLEPLTPHRAIMHARFTNRAEGAFAKLTGSDPALEATKQRAGKLAATSLPLLLLAETGTGKERLARAIHEGSPRASGPFVAVNCGALGNDLLESELFGYAPGAFTGAKPEGATGKLEAARDGTLFLDEVAEMSPACQSALLRVLEDGSYYRVGEATMKRADVRIVAATCREMEKLVEEGKIRRDLYYRLKGAKLTLPPLREREDIAEIARDILLELTHPAPPPELSPSCIDALEAYGWPGNTRELKNSLHVAWILSDMAPVLERDHLSEEILEASEANGAHNPTSLAEAEASALEAALESAGGNLSKAARLLGIARSTLYRMLERHGMR